jgi:hypothetical protein
MRIICLLLVLSIVTIADAQSLSGIWQRQSPAANKTYISLYECDRLLYGSYQPDAATAVYFEGRRTENRLELLDIGILFGTGNVVCGRKTIVDIMDNRLIGVSMSMDTRCVEEPQFESWTQVQALPKAKINADKICALDTVFTATPMYRLSIINTDTIAAKVTIICNGLELATNRYLAPRDTGTVESLLHKGNNTLLIVSNKSIRAMLHFKSVSIDITKVIAIDPKPLKIIIENKALTHRNTKRL